MKYINDAFDSWHVVEIKCHHCGCKTQINAKEPQSYWDFDNLRTAVRQFWGEAYKNERQLGRSPEEADRAALVAVRSEFQS